MARAKTFRWYSATISRVGERAACIDIALFKDNHRNGDNSCQVAEHTFAKAEVSDVVLPHKPEIGVPLKDEVMVSNIGLIR